jgi:ribosomal protein S18 acetylase RimI-like enzyme
MLSADLTTGFRHGPGQMAIRPRMEAMKQRATVSCYTSLLASTRITRQLRARQVLTVVAHGQRVAVPGAPSMAGEMMWQLRPNADRPSLQRMGPLKVRTLEQGDLPAVATLQAGSFHEPQAVPFLNSIAYNNFSAEIKDGLRKKLVMLGDTFLVLVAEMVHQKDAGVLGVVEVAVGFEQEVLQRLPLGTQSYSYISSMAVSTEHRRMGIASALLAAAEGQAEAWKQEWCALHVYEDNGPALQLYESRGFTAAAQDPQWRRWLGGRVRILLLKKLR